MNFADDGAGSLTSDPVLAEWHCDAELWGKFRAVEQFDARATLVRNVAIVSFLCTPLLLVSTWFGYWRGAYRPFIAEGLVALIITAGAIVFLTSVLLWLYRRQTAAAMDTPTGEVSVSLTGLTINKQRTEWRFGPPGLRRGGGLRFQNCARRTVGSFEMIEFNCAVTTVARYGSEIENNVRRSVPVPSDKTAQADNAIERLNLRFRSAKSEWEG